MTDNFNNLNNLNNFNTWPQHDKLFARADQQGAVHFLLTEYAKLTKEAEYSELDPWFKQIIRRDNFFKAAILLKECKWSRYSRVHNHSMNTTHKLDPELFKDLFCERNNGVVFSIRNFKKKIPGTRDMRTNVYFVGQTDMFLACVQNFSKDRLWKYKLRDYQAEQLLADGRIYEFISDEAVLKAVVEAAQIEKSTTGLSIDVRVCKTLKKRVHEILQRKRKMPHGDIPDEVKNNLDTLTPNWDLDSLLTSSLSSAIAYSKETLHVKTMCYTKYPNLSPLEKLVKLIQLSNTGFYPKMKFFIAFFKQQPKKRLYIPCTFALISLLGDEKLLNDIGLQVHTVLDQNYKSISEYNSAFTKDEYFELCSPLFSAIVYEEFEVAHYILSHAKLTPRIVGSLIKHVEAYIKNVQRFVFKSSQVEWKNLKKSLHLLSSTPQRSRSRVGKKQG